MTATGVYALGKHLVLIRCLWPICWRIPHDCSNESETLQLCKHSYVDQMSLVNLLKDPPSLLQRVRNISRQFLCLYLFLLLFFFFDFQWFSQHSPHFFSFLSLSFLVSQSYFSFLLPAQSHSFPHINGSLLGYHLSFLSRLIITPPWRLSLLFCLRTLIFCVPPPSSLFVSSIG